jgi:hypothetical protein
VRDRYRKKTYTDFPLIWLSQVTAINALQIPISSGLHLHVTNTPPAPLGPRISALPHFLTLRFQLFCKADVMCTKIHPFERQYPVQYPLCPEEARTTAM